MPADIEAVAERVFIALADPTRRAILAELATGARSRPPTWPHGCRSPGRRPPGTWPCWPRPAW
jgi:DNA-binding transcriptional ArsR family regulator